MTSINTKDKVYVVRQLLAEFETMREFAEMEAADGDEALLDDMVESLSRAMAAYQGDPADRIVHELLAMRDEG